MTNKELLYVEDVLGHEKHFQSQCRETARRATPMRRSFRTRS